MSKRSRSRDQHLPQNKRPATDRTYSCRHCPQKSFETTNPVTFSNHVRLCKSKQTAASAVSNCLHDQTISFSLWTKPDATRPYDESDLRATLVSLGGTFSATVHKKVRLLIATRDAVRRGTQRVRKAAKKNITIVQPEWLKACAANKARVNPADYALAYTRPTTSSTTSKEDANVNDGITGDLDKEDAEAAEDLKSSLLMEHVQTFDLGCCCGCHDNPSATSCEWCPECYQKE